MGAPGPRQFLDALGDGVYAVDRQGCCTFINRAALAALGYDGPGELLGRNMHEAIHHTRPDGSTYPVQACPLLGTLSTGRPVRLDNELLWRRDGSSFFAEYSSFPIGGATDPNGSVITFTDLSVRRDSRRRHALQHAIGQLLESEESFGALQQRMVAAIGSAFAWDAGALWLVDGETLHHETGWRRDHTGASADEADPCGPGAALRMRAWTEAAAVTVADGGLGRLAFPIRLDGGVTGVFEFSAPVTIELDADLRDELATLGRQIGQFLQRRRTEAALRDSEALKTAIMDTALDCVVVVDAATHIREFNPAASDTFGWDREAALGSELGVLILPADFLVGHLRKFAAFLEQGEVSAVNKRVEAEAIRANGERFPIEVSVTPLKVSDEELFATTMRDITERKRAEREIADARDAAEDANKAKSRFIASMSHELRTPLSAIIGYSEMLQEEMADAADATTSGGADGGADVLPFAADMAKIESNARHLLGLINDVLDLSKIESGKMEVFAEAFDVAAMARDVVAAVDALVAKKNNTLALRLEPALGTAHTDMVKVKQIVLNLLSNASKFTQDGTITLSVSRRPGDGGLDEMVLEVGDDGIGMTPEQLARLFEAFVQAESSTSRNFGGTGLGLSISRHFAQMLGGGIAVSSEYGHGSRFVVTLPVEIPAAA